MKKLLLLFAMAAVLFACQKDKDPVATEQEVSFSATNVTPNLKGSEDWPCKANIPDHAWIQINGVNYYPELFTLDGKLYTQAIKLPIGVYNVQEFVLYDDVDGVLGITDGDVVVFGTPHVGSAYAVYTTPDVPFEFTVQAFKKIEIDIQVLCFLDAVYDKFGFFWFDITEIVIREQCFFGDLCIEDLELWNVNPYNIGGVLVDEEAYIKIVVKKNGVEVPYSPFNNLSIYGTGLPLCVEYPDNLSIPGETFTFDLYIWVPTNAPGVWDWQLYGTFTTTDNLPIPEAGGDGVVDFAVGTCSPNSFPIYTWLPAPPPPPPVVIEGYTPGGTKKMGVRYRNFRPGGSGWDFAIGPNVGTVGQMNTVDWTYSANWFFTPDYNTISFVYDGAKAFTNVVVNGTTYTSYVEWVGGLGTIDYMQWFVSAAAGQTVEFYDVVLTVGPNSYPLGNFSKTASGTTWSISNYDLTGGFTVNGKIKLTGPSTGDEHAKVEITVKDMP